ncbi:MAG: rod shape-determining protein MreC [Acidobacteriota bacterium]
MSERRAVALLIIVLLAQLGLVSAQVPDRTVDDASALEGILLRVTAPVAQLVSGSMERTTDLRTRVQTMTSLRRENERLRDEVLGLRQERARIQGIEERLDLLLEAVDYEPPVEGDLVVADVVLVDHNAFRKSLIAYLPETAPEEFGVGSPVTTDAGLVGRVYSRSGNHIRVQLITDRASSVGSMIGRTRRQGVVRGDLDGFLSLDYVPLQASVQPGDRVVTAGIDGVYSRGIPVGQVLEVSDGGELFHSVRVVPAVDFGLLTQVYVLERAPELPEGIQ